MFAEFRYFVRWDAILRLREDRKVASRAVFQMLQTGATERMKASMVERLEGVHQEAMQKTTFTYQQQLDVKSTEVTELDREKSDLTAQLEAVRSEFGEFKKQSLQDAAAFEELAAANKGLTHKEAYYDASEETASSLADQQEYFYDIDC